MNTNDYNLKLKNIVSNEAKFKKSNEGEIEQIKKEVNEVISDINKKV